MDDKNIDRLIAEAYGRKADADMPPETFFAALADKAIRARRRGRLIRILSATASAGIAATLVGFLLTAQPEPESAGISGETFYTECIARADERIELAGTARDELRESLNDLFPF